MDNETDSIIPEGTELIQPEVKPQVKKPPVIKMAAKPVRIKPLVEGINAPKNTGDMVIVKSNLTEQEKQLITEQPKAQAQPIMQEMKVNDRLMPESVSRSVNRKNHHIGRWFLVFVVLLILVAGGYEYYCWKLQNGEAPLSGHYHPSSTAANIMQEPFALAGGALATTSTSTMVAYAAATSTPAAATSTAPATPILQVKINSTPTGYLNVRSTPSTGATVLTQVHPGEIYTYTKVQNGWYEITYSGFNQGWVSGQYVTKQ